MGIFTGIIVFLLIWWVTLFAVLPFGHNRDYDGTPVSPNLKQKFLWTTVLSVFIWCIIFALIEADLVSFREMAMEMGRKDDPS